MEEDGGTHREMEHVRDEQSERGGEDGVMTEQSALCLHMNLQAN